jgi:NAD(P)-dependent dehydrogenase (short-subunit alcohol dehydrogenase family)
MKVVLITGSNGGIGTDICKKFKSSNWTVVGTDISEKSTHEFTDTYISTDLTDPSSPEHIIANIHTEYSQLNCIINNAACQICKPVWSMSVEEWDEVYNCNVRSIFLFVKHGVDLLRATKGNMINVSSVHSIATSDEIAAYASSKAAISGLTKNLAIELGKYGIRVNSVCPGAVDTPMLRKGLLRGHAGNGSSDEVLQTFAKTHLLENVGQPREIANFIYFLADDNNGKFINGANLLIDGGASIKLATE